MIEEVMDYLEHAEGWQVHRNKTESDVTAFYGVYRVANPKFEGWWWLDHLAEAHGLEGYRKIKTTRNKLNKVIELEPYLRDIYDDIAKFFHQGEIEDIGLDKFPGAKVALTYFSLYTNSKQGAGLSLQRAISSMTDIYLKIDGVVGKQTLTALSKIKDGVKLNELILQNMQEYYNKLIKQDPEKFGLNAKGWTNRLRRLA